MIRRSLMFASIGVMLLPLAAFAMAPHLLLQAFAATVALHALAAAATFLPRSRMWGPITTRFETTSGGEVWLTIDDGPAKDTREILLLLDRFGARATFFLVGDHIRNHPGDVSAIAAAGHELACHTDSHPAGWFWAYSRARIRAEIVRCNDAIASEEPVPVRRFRPPVGFRNGFTHDVLEQLNMELVSWSRRGFDGIEGTDPRRVVERILDGLAPGDIIMIHQGRKSSLSILEFLLDELAQRGLRCVVPPPGPG